MELYNELLKKRIFCMEDVNVFYDNIESARSAVKRMMKYRLAIKIRNNMYTCISEETGLPVANRFQIASRITPTSYISHHTALEYYGIADRILNDVYVSSETSFREFVFEGYTYRCIVSKSSEGVERLQNNDGVSVTNIERTLVDCVKDMDKISGMEMVIENIENIKEMQEKRLLKYMELFQKQFLFQKMGYLLSGRQEIMGLSEDFFNNCKGQIGKSKRYLTREQTDGRYNAEWKLVVPKDLDDMNNKKVSSNVQNDLIDQIG